MLKSIRNLNVTPTVPLCTPHSQHIAQCPAPGSETTPGVLLLCSIKEQRGLAQTSNASVCCSYMRESSKWCECEPEINSDLLKTLQTNVRK